MATNSKVHVVVRARRGRRDGRHVTIASATSFLDTNRVVIVLAHTACVLLLLRAVASGALPAPHADADACASTSPGASAKGRAGGTMPSCILL